MKATCYAYVDTVTLTVFCRSTLCASVPVLHISHFFSDIQLNFFGHSSGQSWAGTVHVNTHMDPYVDTHMHIVTAFSLCFITLFTCASLLRVSRMPLLICKLGTKASLLMLLVLM
jgi:hypothetical protein